MACDFDNIETGTKVRFPGVTCSACWTDTYKVIITTYLGHADYPSGKCAVFQIDNPFHCSCGYYIDALKVPCEDNNDLVENLFVKVPEEIDA